MSRLSGFYLVKRKLSGSLSTGARIGSAVKDLFKYERIEDFDRNKFIFPNKFLDKNVFDYLIVGGGTAGSVLAWRLLREGYSKVGVIESGGQYPILWSRVPAGLGYAMRSSRATKNYYTTPQPELNNRKITWPRGIGLGGSSGINGMVFVRGYPDDYDAWEAAGATGWSYKDCLPYFMRSENCSHGAASIRGKNGPVKLSRNIDGFCASLVDHFMQAGKEAGFRYECDLSNPDRNGFGFYDHSVFDGTRMSASEAYIPFKYRVNYFKDLKIYSGKGASKIIFDGDKAVGVQVGRKKLFANKEVIIASGAIESPLLLMKSGIGDENELKAEGIACKSHVPGVGKNLQDHLEVYIQATTKERSLYELYSSYPTSALSMFYWYMQRAGPLTSGYLDAGAFLSTDKSIKNPDIQLHFFPCMVLDHGAKLPNYNAFQIHAGTNRPKSKGHLSLKKGQLVIEPNYMSEKQDMEDMIKCVNTAMDIINQPSLKEVTTKIVSDVGDVKSFIKKNAETAYHPAGTCKMGDLDKDHMAVVDSDMKVKGVRNLRVVDASCIPQMISGNLNATVIMMAEKAAEKIIREEEMIYETPDTVPEHFYRSH